MPVPRRAIVTGGANGIGAAVVRRLCRDGMDVLACDLDAEAGNALATEVGAGFEAIDASDVAAIDALVRRFGPYDVLINNVGADQHGFFTEIEPAEWRRLIDVNLLSTFAFTRGVLPAMQAGGYGRIVNVSSEAGRMGSRGGAVYAAAKAGVIGFTRSIARENARFGVTCNAVLPGPTRTPMVERALRDGGIKLERAMTEFTLLKRLGEPDEVAAAIGFLASSQASFITGEVLGVSGGMGCGVA